VPVDYRDVPWGAISSAVIWPFMDKFLVNVHNNRR
jgi:hypothetical protein